MADHTYQGSQAQEHDIDPRLQEVTTTSQPYSNAPALNGTLSHFRPSSAAPFQQQHQQHQHLHHQQQQYGGLSQPWPQDGISYYALPGQQPPSGNHNQQHPAHPFQPYQNPSCTPIQPAMQANQADTVDTKRSRACEACRNLKVKCESNSEGGRCKRCAKAGRNCVISAPSRKRQKKTDSRVADLEKRIDDLQREMKSAKEGNASGSDDGHDENGELSRIDLMSGNSVHQSPYTLIAHGNNGKRLFAELEQDGYSTAGQPNDYASHNERPATDAPHLIPEARMDTLLRSRVLQPEGSDAATITYGQVDVVGRGLLPATTADELFLRYTKLMAQHIPIVVFPKGTTSELVRKSRPILFLAILSVASGEDYQDLQINLNKEIMHTLSGRIIVSGEKSLELIQALQVVTIWYWREANGDSKYYQFVHLAATMAIDLRLNKRAEAKTSLARLLFVDLKVGHTHCFQKIVLPLIGLPLRSIAMGMRRPTLVRHSDNNKYFEDCITRLRESEDDVGLNHKLCDLIRLQTFADNLAAQILPDDRISLSEAKVRSAHRGFEKQMKDWQEQTSKDEEPLFVSFVYNVISLYMYELAMQHLSSPEPSKNPRARGKASQSTTQPGPNTALSSILGILNTFGKFSAEEIRTLPIFHFAQIAHASVSLIKMYFVAKADSEYHENVPIRATMVEERLDGLVHALRSAAGGGRSLGAQTFMKVIGALQILFRDHKHTTLAYIKARFGGGPSMKDTQILDLEEPQPTPQQRTASQRIVEESDDGLQLLHLASAAAMEQSKAIGVKSESDQRGSLGPEDGDVAAVGQLVGEEGMGFMSGEGFLGIMQTLFLKGVR